MALAPLPPLRPFWRLLARTAATPPATFALVQRRELTGKIKVRGHAVFRPPPAIQLLLAGPPGRCPPAAIASALPCPPPSPLSAPRHQGIVLFVIDGEQWTLDLREGRGSLAKGAPAEGEKPDITLTINGDWLHMAGAGVEGRSAKAGAVLAQRPAHVPVAPTRRRQLCQAGDGQAGAAAGACSAPSARQHMSAATQLGSGCRRRRPAFAARRCGC